jgi:hypothetical protein
LIDASFLGLPLPVLKDELPVRGHRGIDAPDPNPAFRLANPESAAFTGSGNTR